ncbi:MAG: hypothetical protein PGN24_06710 [Microbacterium arborescens]
MTRLIVDDTAAVPPTAQMTLRQGRAEVLLDVDLHAEELRRRAHWDTKPILSLDLLNLLLTMPLSSAVPAEGFSDYDWRRLKAGSRIGAVDITGGHAGPRATRRAVPPLTVRHATVRARHWRTGLSATSRFAPYCSRDLILDGLPADDLELRLEADYLGVGVCVRGDDPDQPVRRVIEPARFRPARYTGASWLFGERLLAEHAVVLEG